MLRITVVMLVHRPAVKNHFLEEPGIDHLGQRPVDGRPAGPRSSGRLAEVGKQLLGVEVLVATGNGTAFCAGADLTLARDARDAEERARINEDMGRVPRMIGRIFDVMLHMDVISIAAINGYAVGGGWSIAMGFDHIIAVEEAEFWLPEVEIGRPFRGLANVALTQRLGPALAMEAMVLCRRFTAAELAQYRVINQVCPADRLERETRRVVDAYLAMPWKAAVATRREIHATVYGPQYY